jgi:hypothetical protein
MVGGKKTIPGKIQMNKQKWILLAMTLALISTAAAALHHIKTHQRLGVPGIKATPIPGSTVMQIALPERVLDFASTNLPMDEITTNMLPKDTSFAHRLYLAPDNFWAVGSIVMMGKDRTSIHKPEYCLPGQGMTIDAKTNVNISIGGAHPFELTVARWSLTRPQEGRHGLYVFWFVADHEVTTSHWQRIAWLVRDLLQQGVLQRWAYISYYTECAPGQEAETFDRVQKLIAASVPEFQLPPAAAGSAAVARQ